MCSEEQARQTLHALERIEQLLAEHDRGSIFYSASISLTQPLVIDRKNRKHLYIWTPTAFVLGLEDIGTLPIAANTWAEITFNTGVRGLPLGQATPITVQLCATDQRMSNPAPFLSNFAPYIMGGQSFWGTTGLINGGAGTNSYPLSVFNPVNNTKNIYLFAIHAAAGSAGASGSTLYIEPTSTDPAYTSAGNIYNAARGSSIASTASCTFTTTTTGPNAPYLQAESSNSPIEILQNGSGIFLPAGQGITAFLQTFGAGFVNIVMKWVEF